MNITQMFEMTRSSWPGTVMLWILGGSYVTGGTKGMFNGTRLAEQFGVTWWCAKQLDRLRRSEKDRHS
jgi:carboxylesterase type B